MTDSSETPDIYAQAVSRLRQLPDELRLAMTSFLDLHEAFDADELPLAFILARDSRLTKASAWPRQAASPRAKVSAGRRTMSVRARRRGGPRKQISDEEAPRGDTRARPRAGCCRRTVSYHDSDAFDRRGTAGEFRTSREADGRGHHGARPVDGPPLSQSAKFRLA